MKSASTYIPMDRRLALARGESLPDRSWGAVLFADISGFTPLTATLADELGACRGAEELTQQLNRIYGALIAEVHRYGGSVIGFSGDAITCWLDGDEGQRATACGLAMQESMRQFGHVKTPAGTPISITLKVAVVTGPVRRFVVGEPQFRWIDVLAGRTLYYVAQAEKLAKSGEVLITAQIAARLEGLQIAQWREDEESKQRFAVVTDSDWGGRKDTFLDRDQSELGYSADVPELSEEEASAWLLPSVYERLQSGKGQFLAELRPAVALFLKFKGIDYDEDEEAGTKLDAYIDWIQEILSRYEGSLIQLTIGDKGSYLYAAFGVPIAHDDDAERAVAAALTLQSPPPHLHYIQGMQIGIAKGQMRTGAYGSPTRRTYGVLGDKVNLAARLMSLAHKEHPILCDYKTYRYAQRRWPFEPLPAVRVKGKAGLVRVYRPMGAKTGHERYNINLIAPTESAMVGRQAELRAFNRLLDDLKGGKSNVLIIEGEAGIGKSRLVAEFTKRRRERGLTGLLGAGQNIEQNTPYRAWRDIFSTYFALSQITDASERQQRVKRIVQEVAPEQLERLPLLNDVLDLGLPESELTASLEPTLRHDSLERLLLTLLQAWMQEQPLILVLEDAHWLDSLSWHLVEEVTRAFITSAHSPAAHAARSPLLLLLVTRSLDEYSVGGKSLASLRAIVPSQTLSTLSLSTLSDSEMVELVTADLGLPPDGLPEEVSQLVRTRAGGNPFFAEELLFTLREQGIITIQSTPEGTRRCVISGNLALASQTLPDTLQGLILSRIDRLPPKKQLTLKIAAVMGRSFAYTPLSYLVKRYTNIASQTLKAQLSDFVQHNLAMPELPEPDLTYIFKHIITQEVTYQTLLFSQRRHLHQTVAEWYEQHYGLIGPHTFDSSPHPADTGPHPPNPSPHPPNPPLPQGEGGVAAGSTRIPPERSEGSGTCSETGSTRIPACAGTCAEPGSTRIPACAGTSRDACATSARSFATLRRDACSTGAGRGGQASSMIIPLLVHHYHHAENSDKERYYAQLAGEQAAAQFAHVEAVRYFRRALELAGQDEAARYDLHSSLEAVYALQGARHAQKEQLTILMALAAKMQDTKRLAEVSIRQSDYAEMVCNYPNAIAAAQRAITLAKTIGDQLIQAAGYRLWGRALLRQGQYKSAQQQLLQALRMMSQIESSAEVEKVKGSTLHSLGIVLRQQGDYNAAKRCYQEALTIERTIGDRRGEGATLGNLGMLYQDQGEYVQAQAYYEQDLHITRAIGDRRGEGITLLHLGMVFHAQGDYLQALNYYEQSLPIRQEVGDRRGEGLLLAQLGLLFHHLEENQKAHTYSQQALRIGQEIGSLYVQAYALTFLGHAQVALADLAQATTTYQQALKLRQEMGLPHLAMESLAGLARIALLKGELEEAISHVNQILEYLSSPLATLGGTEEPLRIYLTCYRVLQTATGSACSCTSRDACATSRETSRLGASSCTSRDACATSRGTSRDACATSRGTSCTSRDACATSRGTSRDACTTVTSSPIPKHIQILRTAYDLLSERAAKISDQGRRQMFLENVKVHQKILQEFS